MPKLEFRSNARPSMFVYPPSLEDKKQEEREKVTTAVLTIAARARRQEAEHRMKDSEKMEVMPKLEFRSNARPSMFVYPPPLEDKKREEREKVTTAVLTIAARARHQEAEHRMKDSEKMEVMLFHQKQLSHLPFEAINLQGGS